MIQLFSGVATALERHKIRMKNWYRLRVPRSRRPGARWIMSKLAGIDRIPSLEKRLSQCGDDAMRACRCFPRSTVFKQTRLNGRGPRDGITSIPARIGRRACAAKSSKRASLRAVGRDACGCGSWSQGPLGHGSLVVPRACEPHDSSVSRL